ncbi:uncharacterized protein [Nicotiana sylvestris]|uniref:uncharacterized protein n=1 Tax=Nicotiana sylvestris TaxID=4096 RepID=UPI00388C7765
MVDRAYWSCVVTIGGLETRVDLLLLSMVDFDVILDLDVGDAGVSKDRVERFSRLCFQQSDFIFEGPADGWEGLFIFVRDVGFDTPTIDSALVVQDFLDMFLANLPGMPPDRDIDFGIDLVPGTQPISIPPYHMETFELKELKEQLQELLDKGFIRPSVLSWGAPVLFMKKKGGTKHMCIDYR